MIIIPAYMAIYRLIRVIIIINPGLSYLVFIYYAFKYVVIVLAFKEIPHYAQYYAHDYYNHVIYTSCAN